MKRLHIGDLVMVTLWDTEKVVGVICEIHKYNNESIDNCLYGIAYENPQKEQEVKEIQEQVGPSCEEISCRCYWFERQEIKLLYKLNHKTFKFKDH